MTEENCRQEIRAICERLARLPSSAGPEAGVRLEFVKHKLPARRGGQRQQAEVEVEVEGAQELVEICKLVIRSERAKNALSGKMIGELTAAVDELERWAAGEGPGASRKCLLISGFGGTFCSGSDLETARATIQSGGDTANLGADLARVMQHNLVRITRLPVLSIAHLEGYALGGGAELALAADLRVMAPGARLGMVHAQNGICCGWSGGTRLVQLVGPARALELLASGRLVARDEAQQMGLAANWDDTRRSLEDFCAARAFKSRQLGQAVKSVVAAAASESALERSLDWERQMFAATWGRAAHRAALAQNVKHNARD